jgi:translation elongation factor EF-4
MDQETPYVRLLRFRSTASLNPCPVVGGVIPRQLFEVAIQAQVGNKVIAREK